MPLRRAQERLQQGSACKVIALITPLPKDDIEVFNEWVEARKPAGWIARVLISDGIPCGEKTVKRHLDGLCNCPPETKWKGAYSVSR